MSRLIKAAARLIGLSFIGLSNCTYAASIECPSPITCAPCGETIITSPLPAPNGCGVQPFQNFIATSECCIRSGLNGLYFGTGFGYGTINYNLDLPGVLTTDFKDFSNSYIIEYATLGYAHATSRFFFGVELGYYYNTTTSPVYYDDPTTFIFTTLSTAIDPVISITTVQPCTARIDINAHNHVALDLLPGLALTPRFTLFGRAGLEFTSYNWTRRICIPAATNVVLDGDLIFVGVNGPLANGTGDVNDEESDSNIDFRLGAGMAFAAGRHLSFTVNYVHIFGSEVTFTPNANLINAVLPIVADIGTGLPIPGTLQPIPSTLNTQNTINPDRNEILLGMIVSF